MTVDEKTEEVVHLINEVYAQPNGDAGGGLHIVVDDWNLEDEHIAWCQDNGLTPTEERCARALAGLTLEERAAALGRFDGYH